MTDLKSELIELIEQYLAEQNSVLVTENTSPTNDETPAKPLTSLEKELCDLIDEYSAKTVDTSSNPKSQVTQIETQIDSESETKKESTKATQKNLPIYEATTAQLNFWHASGSNLFLQSLLRRYDLDFSSYNLRAYDEFKIGFDDKRHVATFAIDETHYYMIQFNEFNSAPVNSTDADLVLTEIQRLRFLRYGQPKNFFGQGR